MYGIIDSSSINKNPLLWDDAGQSCQVGRSPGQVSVIVARGGCLVKGGFLFVQQQKRDAVGKPFEMDILAEVVRRALDTE